MFYFYTPWKHQTSENQRFSIFKEFRNWTSAWNSLITQSVRVFLRCFKARFSLSGGDTDGASHSMNLWESLAPPQTHAPSIKASTPFTSIIFQVLYASRKFCKVFQINDLFAPNKNLKYLHICVKSCYEHNLVVLMRHTLRRLIISHFCN